MKSRVINTFSRAMSPWPSRAFSFSMSFSRLSRTGLAVGGAVCALTLSGCYYPYGYYPAGYYPAYTSKVPPVYVAPPYPAYYPPPVYPAYPAYYGYPGYYAPSVSIGIGGYWGGGWGHRHWH
jgi:hypothetical protein